MATSPPLNLSIHDETTSADNEMEPLAPCDPGDPEKPSHFDFITENVYISPSLHVSKDRKRAKRMVCECQFDPEIDDLEDACGENCLNRVLMIECGSRCPCGEYCTNKRFQRAEYSKVEVFKTDSKGWGLKASSNIASGQFVMEYCGEVCTPSDFEQRKHEYEREKRRHYYFMSLKTDEILDATRKGNFSRYINHSCDPNCETQKWTVNGRLRIGFFSIKPVQTEEELTFDYKFQRFGDQAQKCYCGSTNCRGYIGQTKQSSNSLNLKSITPSRRNLGSPRSPRERGRGRQRLMSDADNAFEKEVYAIVGSSWRLKDSVSVLALSRIMLQAETPSQRIMLLQVLRATEDSGCLKKFLSLHGLRLLWSWMVDSGDRETEDVIQFRVQMLQVLDHLPLTTRNQLEENKLLPVVRNWRKRPHSNHSTSKQEEYSATEKNLSPPSQGEEQLEGTIVTEADSVLCEGVVSEGAEVVGDTVDEGTCEAEAIHVSGPSDQSQDEGIGGGDRDLLATLAKKLVEKWEGLKEVFRIPKRTPQAKRSSAEPEDSSNEGAIADGDIRDEFPLPPTKRTKITNSQQSPELTWSRQRKGSRPNVRKSPHTSKQLPQEYGSPYTASPPSQPHTPPTYSSTFSSTTPLQNTLIVQHPGHSVYVQQQVFKDGCQTTILPASYLHTTTTRPQYVHMQQPPGLVLSPLTALAPQPPPQVTAFSHQPHVLTQQTRLMQHPGYIQTPGSTTQSVQGSGMSVGVQASGSAENRTEQQFVQLPNNTQPVFLPGQTISSQPKPLFEVPLSSLPMSALTLAPLPPPPPDEENLNLPLNWKIAHDTSGKVYYYHTITRKTQWERPTDQDAEGTITMDLGTPEPESDSDEHEVQASEVKGPCTPTEERQPHTPEGTPPVSPPTYSTTGPQTPCTAIDSVPSTPHTSILSEKPMSSFVPTVMDASFISTDEGSESEIPPTSNSRSNIPLLEPSTPESQFKFSFQSSDQQPRSVSPVPHSDHLPHTPTHSPPAEVTLLVKSSKPKHKSQRTPPKRRRRKDSKSLSKSYVLKEAFRHKLSKVVTNCLDQHRKPDCKYGRITCNEDFKYLARKLSHGLTEKEIVRKGGVEKLKITDSVKAKAKDYIRQYMKKYGSVYLRTKSP